MGESGKGGRARETCGGVRGVRKSRGGDSVRELGRGPEDDGNSGPGPALAPTPPEQAPPWPDPADYFTRPCSRGPCGCFGTRASPGESC